MFSYALKIYKRVVTPFAVLVFGNGCRLNPTCGEYAKKAFEEHGLKNGGVLTVMRLIRCNPFSKKYFDPVPLKMDNK